MSANINDFTTEQLKAMLAEKTKNEKARLERNRKEYEADRERRVNSLMGEAFQLNALIERFHGIVKANMEEMQTRLQEYGMLRGNSKGGFSLLSQDGQLKISYTASTVSGWDERADKAEELLKDFLGDTVKKRDKKMYDLVISLLERNNKGALEFSRIQDLYKHEDSFDDPRWREALRLFKESYTPKGTKFYTDFWVRDGSGKYQPIKLNFNQF